MARNEQHWSGYRDGRSNSSSHEHYPPENHKVTRIAVPLILLDQAVAVLKQIAIEGMLKEALAVLTAEKKSLVERCK